MTATTTLPGLLRGCVVWRDGRPWIDNDALLVVADWLEEGGRRGEAACVRKAMRWDEDAAAAAWEDDISSIDTLEAILRRPDRARGEGLYSIDPGSGQNGAYNCFSIAIEFGPAARPFARATVRQFTDVNLDAGRTRLHGRDVASLKQRWTRARSPAAGEPGSPTGPPSTPFGASATWPAGMRSATCSDTRRCGSWATGEGLTLLVRPPAPAIERPVDDSPWATEGGHRSPGD